MWPQHWKETVLSHQPLPVSLDAYRRSYIIFVCCSVLAAALTAASKLSKANASREDGDCSLRQILLMVMSVVFFCTLYCFIGVVWGTWLSSSCTYVCFQTAYSRCELTWAWWSCKTHVTYQWIYVCKLGNMKCLFLWGEKKKHFHKCLPMLDWKGIYFYLAYKRSLRIYLSVGPYGFTITCMCTVLWTCECLLGFELP